MKLIHFHRKSISMFVMFTFTVLLCLWANQAPAAPTAAKNSEATMEQGDSHSPNFIEQEKEPEGEFKKAKKFPWLLVGAAVVIGAVAVYFLVIKKPKYTLTVTLGTGTTGTPAATAKFTKGEAVPYSYTPQAGYGNLQVKLDGVAVPASGSVTIDKDHTLDVSATQQYTLTVHLGVGTTGTPAATATYNKDEVVPYNYSAKAGYSNLQVILDGTVVGNSGNVAMNNNHTLDVYAVQGFTLTVHLGVGTSGTPAATASYASGQIVNYSYTTQGGYAGLQVLLDGVVVGASGSFAMNSNRTIATSAVYGATVNINSIPSGAKVFDNFIDSGKTTNTSFSYTTNGVHTYLLRQCGYQDYTKTESVLVGQIYNINATLLPGILDDFLVSPTCWVPYSYGNWTVASGLYQADATVTDWNFSYYDSPATTSTYTVEVKMKRVKGTIYNSNSILLVTGSDMTNVSGYLFNYVADGEYSIWRETSFNLKTGDSSESTIRDWTVSSKINKNLGAWNTLKIVRSGDAYSFYINDAHVWSFNNDYFDPSYLILAFHTNNERTEVQYDYVKLTPGAAMGLMPGERVTVKPITGQKGSQYKKRLDQ